MFECKVCNNKDKRYIGYKNNIPYCRKCIQLKTNAVEKLDYEVDKKIKADIHYDLTDTQQKASNEILGFVKKNQSVLVNAVCGAGKTELVYQSIEYFLNQGKVIGFTIPRKDVVIEIYNRLKKDYPDVEVVSLYGGHTSKLTGQIIVLTTYQLYRYKNYFDLLILDEADAFPYYNDWFLKRSCKNVIIYLSATFNDKFLKEIPNHVEVNRRFHNYDLPIPRIQKVYFFNKIKILKDKINEFLKTKKQVLIFVPTVKIGKALASKINIQFVYSNSINKEKIIDRFKKNEIKVLITTTILERGITIDNVQVIVYNAEHELFDLKTLIQISGRVGRKKAHPNGDIIFLCSKKTKAINECVLKLKSKNNVIV